MTSRGHSLVWCALAGLAVLPSGRALAAAKEEVINSTLPSYPDGLIGVHGTLYGAAEDGPAGQGSIYALEPSSSTQPSSTVKFVNVFDYQGSYGEPSSLALDRSGNFYVNELNTRDVTCETDDQQCGFFIVEGKSSTQVIGFPNREIPQGKVAIGRQGKLYLSLGDRIVEIAPPASGAGAYTVTTIASVAAVGALVIGPRGGLYGVTQETNAGVERDSVFRLAPAGNGIWQYHVLKTFAAGIKVGQIAVPAVDVVFGTTSPSGAACSAESCAVFELTPPAGGGAWTETVIYDFSTDPLGHPLHGYEKEGVVEQDILSFGPDGSIYGAIAPAFTSQANSTVYRLTPPAVGSTAWTETALYTFQTPPKPSQGSVQGFFAGSSMVINQSGVVYGTAIGGVYLDGAYQNIAFRITQ